MVLLPMKISAIVDLSLRIYRDNFIKIMLLMFCLLAPVNLLQSYFMYDFSQIPLLPDYGRGFTVSGYFINAESAQSVNPAGLIIGLLLLPVSMAAYIFFQAAVSFMVKYVLDGVNPDIKEILVKSKGRFFPLVGSSIIFFLALSGVIIVLMIPTIALLVMMGVVTEVNNSGAAVFLLAVILTLLILGAFIAVFFFYVRFGFFFPVVVFQNDLIGMGKSWNLTRGNFFRMAAVFFISYAVYVAILAGLDLVVLITLGFSIVGQLGQVLINMALFPIMSIVYTVAYFDLMARREGVDIEGMLRMAEARVIKAGEAGTEFRMDNGGGDPA
ncbi:MAG: hypothetical protein ACOY31_09390 [Bacillota bacterium]